MRGSRKTIERAKSLRQSLTRPEALLWISLSRRRLDGLHFRKQHPIGPYVLDFYCAEATLAVEVDGFSHNLGDRPQRDERRDDWLGERGIETLRLEAQSVIDDPQMALDTILGVARRRAPSTPS